MKTLHSVYRVRTILTLCYLAISAAIFAQPPRKLLQTEGYQLTLDEPSVLAVPPGYDPQKKYPLVVFFPYTGGSAENFRFEYQAYGEEVVPQYELMDSLKRMPTPEEVEAYRKKLEPKRKGWTKETWQLASMLKTIYGAVKYDKGFFAMMPPGIGSTKDHSWQGFEACIYRYENRVFKDLREYSKQYNIDTTRVVLAGYSLGGDLSWAITQRYPEKFKGAIVCGSGCTYAEKGMMTRQAKAGLKYYFALGESELARRSTGTINAKASLDKVGVKNKLSRMRGEHIPATTAQFKEALEFILYE